MNPYMPTSYGQQYGQQQPQAYTTPQATQPYAPQPTPAYNPQAYSQQTYQNINYASSGIPYNLSLLSQYAQQTAPPPPPPAPPTPPPASVSPAAASKAIQRFISSELKYAGFDSTHPTALETLEKEVVFLIERLHQRAHEFANLSNRAGPIATDLILACTDVGMDPSELAKWRVKTKRQRRKNRAASIDGGRIELRDPPSRSPSPDLLPSDEEDNAVAKANATPLTLRTLPDMYALPTLPPKHTYHRTPLTQSGGSSAAPSSTGVPSLEKKLKTAGLVQDSLRNLMLQTEASGHTQEDSDLLGHVVNWEAVSGGLGMGAGGTNASGAGEGARPRKRWRV
ncbi:hypothetical protein CYLTODRAFT_427391 [Cylindrobasidium torrendii FP15055 ss-10]|uniref:Transcription initiation factor TFIID subunit 8 n=1 Tax=Cylindrobasidium torrendii FP15055 ss-10 TaxID=1314674 RepID=A0A0D7AWR6_9AGAR|nr:hypothetical protein CYLTODRAFT_427391 [Cylindrobasidium torrendii FP15055 ss-10]